MLSEPAPEPLFGLGHLFANIPLLGSLLTSNANGCDTVANGPSSRPQTKACRSPRLKTNSQNNPVDRSHANQMDHMDDRSHEHQMDRSHADHMDHTDDRSLENRMDRQHYQDRGHDKHKGHQRHARSQLGLAGLLRRVGHALSGDDDNDDGHKRKQNVKFDYTTARRNEKTNGPNGKPMNHQETMQALHASVSSSNPFAHVPVTVTHPNTAAAVDASQNQHSTPKEEGNPLASPISLSKFMHYLPPGILAHALNRSPGSPFTVNFPTTENIPSTITLKLPSRGKSKPIINLVLHIVPQGHKMTAGPAMSQQHSVVIPPPAVVVPTQTPLPMPRHSSAPQFRQIIQKTTTQKSFDSSSRSNISLVNFKANNHGLSRLPHE